MRTLVPKVVAERYRALKERYLRVHNLTEYELTDVIQWALTLRDDDGRPFLSRAQEIEVHREILGQALRCEKRVDRHGRSVRVNVCAAVEVNGDEDDRPVQRTLWAHIDTASEELMILSLQQAATAIGADIQQFQAQLDAYNERRVRDGLRPFQPDLPWCGPSD
jgi:hypothetical protein